MADFGEATADKVTAEHAVIDEAIQDRGAGYTVFSIVRPPYFFFRVFHSKGGASFFSSSPSALYTVHRRVN